MKANDEGSIWSGTLAAGLGLPAILTLAGYVRGCAEVLAQGYLAQGVPFLAAKALVKPALELAPAGIALGVALATIFLASAWLYRKTPRLPVSIRALCWIGMTGALWSLLRGLRLPGVDGPGWRQALALAVAAATVWFVMRFGAKGSGGASRARAVAWFSKAASLVMVLALLLWAATYLAQRVRRPPGPNIIVIAIDTLRYDHLGFAGYERPTSPALDSLARESVRFERSYSAAPWTSPSIATLLTSRYPGELGYSDSATPARLGASELLLPEILSDRGYATDAIVSHTYVAEPAGFDQGFDTFDSENALGHHYVSSPSLLSKALAKLDQRAGRPFFLFLHLFDPHFAYVQHDGLDFDPRYMGPIVSDLDYSRLLAMVPEMTGDDIQHVRALYDSEIAFTDRNLGLLFDGLEERNLADRTIVALTADHGEAFLDREDGWIGHGITLFDELIRVPLLFRPPGGVPDGGRSVTDLVGLVDVAPTLLAAAEIEPPAGWAPEGRALLAYETGAEPATPAGLAGRALFAETMARGRWLQAVLWQQWKLVFDRREESVKLFDLIADPGETRDLAVEQPETRDRLTLVLEQWDRRQQEAKSGRPIEEAAFTGQELERLEALGYIE